MSKNLNFLNSISIVIPLHNKEKTIVETIKNITSLISNKNIEIIIVENGSTDNSKSEAIKAIKKYGKNYKIDLLESSLGMGNALKKGFDFSNNDWIYFMPADFAFGISDIDFIFRNNLFNKFDVFVGSKAHPSSKINRKISRKIYSKIFNKVANKLFNISVSDTQGTLIIKRETYNKIKPIESNGFLFSTEVIIRLSQKNVKIFEVPVIEVEIDSISTVSPFKDGLKMFFGLLKLKKIYKKI